MVTSRKMFMINWEMTAPLVWVPERMGGEEGERENYFIILSRNFSAEQNEAAARRGGL